MGTPHSPRFDEKEILFTNVPSIRKGNADTTPEERAICAAPFAPDPGRYRKRLIMSCEIGLPMHYAKGQTLLHWSQFASRPSHTQIPCRT